MKLTKYEETKLGTLLMASMAAPLRTIRGVVEEQFLPILPLLASNEHPACEGTKPHRIVLRRSEAGGVVTHMETTDDNGYHHGNYFTRSRNDQVSALMDYIRRCLGNNVNPLPMEMDDADPVYSLLRAIRGTVEVLRALTTTYSLGQHAIKLPPKTAEVTRPESIELLGRLINLAIDCEAAFEKAEDAR